MDSHPCAQDGCPGTCRYVDDEFGPAAEGDSFEVWSCDTCSTTTRVPLPD